MVFCDNKQQFGRLPVWEKCVGETVLWQLELNGVVCFNAIAFNICIVQMFMFTSLHNIFMLLFFFFISEITSGQAIFCDFKSSLPF